MLVALGRDLGAHTGLSSLHKKPIEAARARRPWHRQTRAPSRVGRLRGARRSSWQQQEAGLKGTSHPWEATGVQGQTPDSGQVCLGSLLEVPPTPVGTHQVCLNGAYLHFKGPEKTGSGRF